MSIRLGGGWCQGGTRRRKEMGQLQEEEKGSYYIYGLIVFFLQGCHTKKTIITSDMLVLMLLRAI